MAYVCCAYLHLIDEVEAHRMVETRTPSNLHNFWPISDSSEYGRWRDSRGKVLGLFYSPSSDAEFSA